MKTIIRIEHPSDGLGIFGSRKKGIISQYVWGSSDKPADFDYNPIEVGSFFKRHYSFNEPYQDGIKDFTEGKHFCAYKSLDQLRQWITSDEIKQLLSLGFKVYMLDVSECLEGEDQVVYDKEHILQSIDISSQFKNTQL